jgi:DNA-binding NarL/FixJ family response regulator
MQALVVEDQPVFRVAIENLLRARLGEVELCFVETVAEASRCLEDCEPRLVLADFSTGDVCAGRGFEEIVTRAAGAPVIALDRRPIGLHVRRAQAAGARGYIAKTAKPDLIDAAIGVVLAGGDYFPQTPTSPERWAETRPEWVARLTSRQAEVLRLLMEGKSNREISAQLGLALSTVKLHVHAILRAAGARNRTEAVLRAKMR